MRTVTRKEFLVAAFTCLIPKRYLKQAGEVFFHAPVSMPVKGPVLDEINAATLKYIRPLTDNFYLQSPLVFHLNPRYNRKLYGIETPKLDPAITELVEELNYETREMTGTWDGAGGFWGDGDC